MAIRREGAVLHRRQHPDGDGRGGRGGRVRQRDATADLPCARFLRRWLVQHDRRQPLPVRQADPGRAWPAPHARAELAHAAEEVTAPDRALPSGARYAWRNGAQVNLPSERWVSGTISASTSSMQLDVPPCFYVLLNARSESDLERHVVGDAIPVVCKDDDR